MGKGLQALRIMKQQQRKAEQDRNKRGQAFMDEYREISKKYRIDFHAELDIKPNGIKAVLRLKELEPEPEMKPWSEAKKENLERRKKCTHVKRNDNVPDCKVCGLPEEHWGADGKGATESYVERTEAAIQDIAKAEEEEKKQREEAANEEETETEEAEETEDEPENADDGKKEPGEQPAEEK